jgi:hypothetical protein
VHARATSCGTHRCARRQRLTGTESSTLPARTSSFTKMPRPAPPAPGACEPPDITPCAQQGSSDSPADQSIGSWERVRSAARHGCDNATPGECVRRVGIHLCAVHTPSCWSYDCDSCKQAMDVRSTIYEVGCRDVPGCLDATLGEGVPEAGGTWSNPALSFCHIVS